MVLFFSIISLQILIINANYYQQISYIFFIITYLFILSYTAFEVIKIGFNLSSCNIKVIHQSMIIIQ